MSLLLSMVVILGVAAVTVGMVVVGIEGRGRRKAPQLADSMARAAKHLNGDAETPPAFTRAFTKLLG